jgi:hypothetical protein
MVRLGSPHASSGILTYADSGQIGKVLHCPLICSTRKLLSDQLDHIFLCFSSGNQSYLVAALPVVILLPGSLTSPSPAFSQTGSPFYSQETDHLTWSNAYLYSRDLQTAVLCPDGTALEVTELYMLGAFSTGHVFGAR